VTAEDRAHDHNHDGEHDHSHDADHGHSHGLLHASIKRSRAGLRAVSLSLVVLLATALAQVALFVATSSVALLADLIHNFGDALTAVRSGPRSCFARSRRRSAPAISLSRRSSSARVSLRWRQSTD
jgi:Co/Zn/Cd efflux system component